MCEHPEFYETKKVKARKDYRCCECGDVIGKGDRYSSASGKWEGVCLTFKTCLNCAETWAHIVDNFDIDCQFHGGLSETIDNLEILDPEDEEDIKGPCCTIGTLVPWLRRGRSGQWQLVVAGGANAV